MNKKAPTTKTRTYGEQLNDKIQSVRELTRVEGFFAGGETLMNDRGEEVLGKFGQPLEYFTLRDFDTEAPTRYWLDGGLKGALKMARVREGASICIEFTGQTQKHPEWGTELPVYKILPVTLS